jgi:hypothetical protein
MTILIGQHEFDGPVIKIADIPAAPGLYALLHRQDSDFLLVEIDQSNNLAKSLKKSAATFSDKMIVFLRCDSGDRRHEILNELLQEFEFEDEEPTQATPPKWTETKSDLAVAV